MPLTPPPPPSRTGPVACCYPPSRARVHIHQDKAAVTTAWEETWEHIEKIEDEAEERRHSIEAGPTPPAVLEKVEFSTLENSVGPSGLTVENFDAWMGDDQNQVRRRCWPANHQDALSWPSDTWNPVRVCPPPSAAPLCSAS